nr:MAG TPA: hypothetical protein [Caudoviricetes sp.]
MQCHGKRRPFLFVAFRYTVIAFQKLQGKNRMGFIRGTRSFILSDRQFRFPPLSLYFHESLYQLRFEIRSHQFFGDNGIVRSIPPRRSLMGKFTQCPRGILTESIVDVIQEFSVILRITIHIKIFRLRQSSGTVMPEHAVKRRDNRAMLPCFKVFTEKRLSAHCKRKTLSIIHQFLQFQI